MAIISLNWAAALALEDSLGIELKPVTNFREMYLARSKYPITPYSICRHGGFLIECWWCTINGEPTKARLFYDALDKRKGKKPEKMTGFARQFGINNSEGHRMFKLYTKNNESGKWNIMYEDD